MNKNNTNESKRDTRRAANILDTAEIVGVSQRQVERVLSGDQQNETVVAVFMELTEAKSLLLETVKKLVPFN